MKKKNREKDELFIVRQLSIDTFMYNFNFTVGYQIWTNNLKKISNYFNSYCRTLDMILLLGMPPKYYTGKF